MTDVFSTPNEYANDLQASDLHSSLAERLAAQGADALDPQNSLSGAWLFRRARELSAGGADLNPGTGGEAELFMDPAALQQRQSEMDARRAAIPDVSMSDAKARVKQEGLEGHVTLPSQDSMKAPVLDLMMSEAHERRDREAAIARGPQGFLPGALGLVTSLGVGMIDPVNAAAFSIPVLGEARWGKLLYSAGDSMLARGGVRALQGGAQGAVGTAVLQPADWWLHTRDGQDYTMADALKNVAMGAGMGAVAHAGFGAFGDIGARRRGMALPGSPQDLLERGLMTGRHVPAEALSEEGISADQLAALGGTPAPAHPADVVADLPPAAREDALRSAAADVIADRPVRSAEMLDIAADHDPRIAESIEAFHGSPHDFERFSTEGIGTGEGAQAFGHGLYFAENEKVAKGYQRTTSDRAFVDKVAQLYDEGFSPDDAWNEIKDNWSDFSPGEQRLMTALEKDQWLGFDYPHQAVNAALRSLKNYDASPETVAAARAIGNMYRVKINANHEHFLDWDKPLSEQSPHVQAALKKAGVSLEPTWSVDEGGGRTDHLLMAGGERIGRIVETSEGFEPFAGRSGEVESGMRTKTLAEAKKWVEAHAPEPRGLGEDIVRHLERSENPQQAAAKLQEAGIPGIKYLDQGSRGPATIYNVGAPREDFGPYTPFTDQAEAQGHLEMLRSHGFADAEIKEQHQPQSRNFVVFNDKHIEITHKNGEAVKLPEQAPQRETAVTINGKTTRVEYPSHGDRAAAAADDPRWRALADAPPAHSDPQAMAESKTADAEPEPASVQPDKSISAIEKAAAEVEDAWRKSELAFTEEERQSVNEALDKIASDAKAREQIITEGAMCLAGRAIEEAA